MRRITRDRKLTPEEAQKYDMVRNDMAKELGYFPWIKKSEKIGPTGTKYQTYFEATVDGFSVLAYNDTWAVWLGELCIAQGKAGGVNTAKKRAEEWMCAFKASKTVHAALSEPDWREEAESNYVRGLGV